ncbi:glyoxalase [Actinocatenispora comari]|uniref:Glyoxalase n=2 Tax=Actinocatenispora comari TaxID=2807577 RepID=A0A8J4EJS1_9ACTN|nr:glyoxalase [Actinocatenispora comari]
MPASVAGMAHQVQVTFDAADPARLAEFWALALGYVAQPPPAGFDSWERFAERIGVPPERAGDLAAVIDPDGAGPRIFLQRVPEGKTAKNRVHLDIQLTGGDRGEDAWRRVTEHVATLVAAGARRLWEVDEPTGRAIVLADPEGNEFCVT